MLIRFHIFVKRIANSKNSIKGNLTFANYKNKNISIKTIK